MTTPAPRRGRRAPAIHDGWFETIGGAPQWLTLRGRRRDNPALMILPGPGAAFSRMAPLFSPWEARLTLAQWDQPGGGATWAARDPADGRPLTLERLIRDGLEAAAALSRRLDGRRIALLALSGGSVVGLMMVRRRPELFSAFVGCGQFVHWARQEAASWDLVLARAQTAGDAAAIAELEDLGPPPWPDVRADEVKSRYAGALTPAEATAFAAVDPAVLAAVERPPLRASWAPGGLALPEPRAQGLRAYAELRAELQAFDAYSLGPRFEIPMLFLQGADDAYAVTAEVEAYANFIEAPLVRFDPIPGGGHSPWMMREDFLTRLVRALERAGGD